MTFPLSLTNSPASTWPWSASLLWSCNTATQARRRELAQLVGMNLERNIRRAEVIGQQEVARWIDENELLECPELGKALDADIVIGIDLEDFRLV